jgi:hypothetical protein
MHHGNKIQNRTDKFSIYEKEKFVMLQQHEYSDEKTFHKKYMNGVWKSMIAKHGYKIRQKNEHSKASKCAVGEGC